MAATAHWAAPTVTAEAEAGWLSWAVDTTAWLKIDQNEIY
jgi:hypothetical protein